MMSKYQYAQVHDMATIIESDMDKDRVKIWSGARVQKSELNENVSIGNDTIVVNCTIDEGCSLGRRNIISNSNIERGTSTQGNTTIRYSSVGKYCAIAWNVTIGAPNHDIHRLAMAELDYIFENEEHEHLKSFDNLECSVGNDVWIAAGAHVLRGVKIADGAVVAANAVVTKDVPPYAIVAGVPAKIIGYRFTEKQVESLLDICWWNFSKEKLAIAREWFEQEMSDDIIDKLKELKGM